MLKWMSGRGDWRRRIVDAVPLPFLTRPHELAIALVLLVLGVPALMGLLPSQEHPLNPVPFWVWRGWGATMTGASVATIVGVFTNRVRMEWSGQLLAGYGLVFFTGILVALAGFSQTYPTVLVFLILAVVSWWRCFKLSSASYIQHRLTQAARHAHVRVANEQRGRRHG